MVARLVVVLVFVFAGCAGHPPAPAQPAPTTTEVESEGQRAARVALSFCLTSPSRARAELVAAGEPDEFVDLVLDLVRISCS